MDAAGRMIELRNVCPQGSLTRSRCPWHLRTVSLRARLGHQTPSSPAARELTHVEMPTTMMLLALGDTRRVGDRSESVCTIGKKGMGFRLSDQEREAFRPERLGEKSFPARVAEREEQASLPERLRERDFLTQVVGRE